MKKLLMAFTILCVMAANVLLAQNIPLSIHAEKKHGAYVKPGSNLSWIEFKKNVPFNAEYIFRDAPDLIGMSPNDAMQLFKTNIDEAGNKHFKFAQYYNGVRIEGLEYYAHERNGVLHLINGNFVADINMNTIPAISGEQAVQNVLAAYPAETYLWEDADAEAAFKIKRKNELATLYPTPELLIVKINPNGPFAANNYILAYRMYVFAKKPHIAQYVYVNAQTGAILRDKSLDHSCNSTTIETTFNGPQLMYTDYREESCNDGPDEFAYFSINDCNTDSEIRSNMEDADGDDYLICDEDNDWGWIGPGGSSMMAITSLWTISESFKYYDIVHGHESFDGSSGLIDLFSNHTYYDEDDDPYCTNANYTSILDNIYFGAGNDCSPGTTDDYNTLDIAGHEFMHGIIEYAHFDALDYSEESGALNESFADIFGEMVEYWIEGGAAPSWLMAEDRGAIRSMSNPNDFNDPDTYFGDYWASLDGGDNGGVHTNSGIQNHMFYLLSEGGEGVNDYDVEYQVEGIGYVKARTIAWSAMMNYLNAADGYITARNAWIQAAIDLYGSCSQEVISVGQAFQAVGVTKFTSYDIASVCGTYILTGFADATYAIENKSTLFGEFTTACNTTINSSAIVTFESGYFINLNPGFEAVSGCTFVAWIDECEMSEYDPDDTRYVASSEQETIVENALTQLDIFPIPATNFITLSVTVNNADLATIYLSDMAGQLVGNRLVNQQVSEGLNQFEFDVSSLSAGVYFATFKTNNTTQTAKFVVMQ